MHETPGAPVRIGRVIVKPNGERITLSPLVDAAYGDATGDPTLPPCRDLDAQGNVVRFPADDETEDGPQIVAP